MATWRPSLDRVDMGGEVSTVGVLAVSRDFLSVLGYAPALGRGFAASDHAPDGPRVALVSHTMWRTYFRGAADVVGHTIRLNDEPFTITGVLPDSFSFPYEDEPVEVIVPLGLAVDPADVAEDWPAIARLREGVTRAQAQADVASRPALRRRGGMAGGSHSPARHRGTEAAGGEPRRPR